MQQYVQKSISTTCPFSSASVRGSEWIQSRASEWVNSVAGSAARAHDREGVLGGPDVVVGEGRRAPAELVERPERGPLRMEARGAGERAVEEVGDARVLAAENAVRVLPNLDLAVLHLQGVVHHQAADQRLADAGEQLDGLVHLDRADRRAQDAEHAALGAARHESRRRRSRIQTPVTRTSLCVENADLSVEPQYRAVHVRLAEDHAGVVRQVARREVVRAVDDDVVLCEERHESIEHLADEQKIELFIELGPGGVVAGLVKRTRKEIPVLSIGDGASLAAAVAQLKA